MNKLLQSLVSILLFAMGVSQLVYADGYVSWKEGTFHDHSTNFDVEYEKNDGSFREISFDFGNKDIAQRLNGNVLYNKKDDKVMGYSFGLVLSNDDQLFIRTLSINDKLYDNGNNHAFIGKVDASLQEIGYMRALGNSSQDGLSLLFMYGQSSLPTYYDVENKYFIDLAPETKYVTVGLRRDEMRQILTDKIKSREGVQWYFDGDMTFGFIQQKTSSNLYGMAGLYNANTAGIKNQSGYDGVVRAFAEFGPAYVMRHNGLSGAASIGLFGEYVMPWISGLLPINTTSTGSGWGLGGHMGWGLNGRVAIRF